MVRALLLLLAMTPACGLLFPGDPLDFRDYPLEGVSYQEAVDILQVVIVQEFNQRFGGGYETDWEPETGNMVVEGIRDDTRTLTLYVKLVPDGDDTTIEMLALVRPVNIPTLPHAKGQRPMQDVRFEEVMYDAFVIEALKRVGAGS